MLLLNGELELQNVTSLVSTEGEKLRLGMAWRRRVPRLRRGGGHGLEVPHPIAKLMFRIKFGIIFNH